MDLYPKNPTVLRKLLAKRQNPCTQIFKSQQPLNTPNQLKTKVNFHSKVTTSAIKNQHNYSTSTQKPTFTPKNPLQNPSINIFSPNFNQSHNINKNLDENLDSFEKIEKKIKTTSEENLTRKTSFDDDKSDHSTACDTHSEGTPLHEVGEFLCSPLLHPQPSKEPVVIEIEDDDNVQLKYEHSFHTVSSYEEISASGKARNQAERLGGSCLSCNCSPNGKFKFMCKLRHQFELTIEELDKKWCQKCENLLRKCQLFAKANNGVCLNEMYDETLRFMCGKGHEWSAHHRYFSTKWCLDCAEEEKNEFKKKCEEARKKREKMEEEAQRKLFEEARRKAMGNASEQGKHIDENILEYFQKIDLEVENLARKETEKFMSENEGSKKVNFQQTLQVYKILIMPEEILQKYL